MTADDVVAVLAGLAEAGVDVVLDGGWGVDALLGEETRPHSDLDLALDRDSVGLARRVLEEDGFVHDSGRTPGLPARLVMRDPRGREVDLHPLTFDEDGGGWQQLSESGRSWGHYPAEGLASAGVIGGRPVRCLSASLQLRFRLGYEWTERDEHDLRRLIDRFEIPHPPPLRRRPV